MVLANSPGYFAFHLCIRLLPYNFTIVHKPEADNIANYISRNPLSETELLNHEDIAERYINMISTHAVPNPSPDSN